MSGFDPIQRTREYHQRVRGDYDARVKLRRMADAAAGWKAVATGSGDEQYVETLNDLPEADASHAGRLVYQRRDNGNDLLYLGIINDAGDPQWVLVSELQETPSSDIGVWMWSNYTTSTDTLYGAAVTSTPELLTLEKTTTPTCYVRRRNVTTGASIGTFGSYGTGSGQFQDPRGIAVSSAGNIHVVDYANNRVVQYNSSRTFVRNIGSTGTGNGQLTGPTGVACDSSGNVYVVDSGNARVAVFSSTGTWLRNFGSSGSGAGQFIFPSGIAISSTGEAYVTDLSRDTVVVYNGGTGAFVREFGSTGSANGQFKDPYGIAVDASDNLYVTDAGNARVTRLTTTGTPTLTIGLSGTSATQANAVGAYGIAISGSDVFITAKWPSGYRSSAKKYSIMPVNGVQVAGDGVISSIRPQINFISGPGVSVAVADDATNLKSDVTIKALPQRIVLYSFAGNTVAAGNTVWTNMPAAETLLFGYTTHDYSVPVNLIGMTEARVILRSNSAYTGSTIRIKYASSAYGASATFATLAASGYVSAALSTVTGSTDITYGSWTAIASGAKFDSPLIAPFGVGGNAAADPYILYVAVEFR